jgi:hypothetical protein
MSQTTTNRHAWTFIRTNMYAEIIQKIKTLKEKVFIIHL